MIEIKQNCVPGTSIKYGNSRRRFMNKIINILLANDFNEINMPALSFKGIFSGLEKENESLFYTFSDMHNRELCIAPEYTTVLKHLANVEFKGQRDVRLFYVQECFRSEKPIFNRAKQFTQIGVEVLNPTGMLNKLDALYFMRLLAKTLVETLTLNVVTKESVEEDLWNIYIDETEFKLLCPELGALQCVATGGKYIGGVGFSLDIDRLMIIHEKQRREKEVEDYQTT